ncbi:MAG: hypothetical protein ACO260_00660 [Hylemonella sp.]
MKEEILKRAMFAMPLSKDARNSGILSGFDMDEMGEMPEPEEFSEEMPQMARTPQNPEILMNTLRGDMRSVDARYQELAQMVGEEAAMETPPEVLAMLQMQLGAQQGGIGALPGAQGMAPAGMPQPEAGGMPQQPPAGPQGIAAAMPPGMASAPPFSQGGAEQAPPQQYAHGGAVEPMTPDGMPPMHAQVGAFVTPLTRAAQWMGDKVAPLAAEANIVGGRLMSQGFPQTFRPIFENVRGAGGRYTAEQVLKYPTLTQHLSNLVGPQVSGAVERAGSMMAPAAATGAGMIGASGLYKSMFGGEKVDPERLDLMQKFEQEYYRTRDRSIPMPNIDRLSNEQLIAALGNLQTMPPMSQSGTPAPATPAAPKTTPTPAPAATSTDPLGDFIQAKLAAQQERDAAAEGAPGKPNVATPTLEPAMSRMERIKAAQKEYAPLYKELLGDTKGDMETNALLMLADAGFKYAGMTPRAGMTPVSMLAAAASDIPQGFMALLAQARDRQIKIDTAALSQAVSDVQEQDKYAQQLKLELLKGDYRLLSEQIKQGGGVLKDGAAGLVIAETKNGGYKGVSIDPNNPTVQSAVNSRYTLRPTDNPFVENRGEAPTTVETNKEERVKLTSTLRSLDNSLSTLDNLKGVYSQAYGPGAWFSDKVNNLLVPVLPTAIVRPDVNLTDASTRISTGMNSILKNIASANDGGRVAVQEQEWARDTAKGISDPTKFFADKELAAKQFNSMETMLRNARQQVLTQLGYEKNDYAMRTPNTGTQSDPFQIPQDADQAKRMYNFLGSTIGKLQDPRATVYIRMPNGSVQGFNPVQLRGLVQ